MFTMQMCFQGWGMFRSLSRSFFNVSCKAFLICFVFSCPLKLPMPIHFFLFNLHASFERLLVPSSFECPKAPLLCRQVTLPILNGGIGFISTETIVSTSFVRNWALVVQIIDFRFLLDSHSFLLEVIGMNNLSSLPF